MKNGIFIDDELNRYGLDPLEIKKLKNVIFFLDGYDELGEKVWLFEKDWLKSWANAKVIITCRSQHLSKSDDFHFFYRVDPLTNRPDKEGLRSLYITPFSEKQVDTYLWRFIRRLVADEEQWKDFEAYKKLFLNIYNLRWLSSDPFYKKIVDDNLRGFVFALITTEKQYKEKKHEKQVINLHNLLNLSSNPLYEKMFDGYLYKFISAFADERNQFEKKKFETYQQLILSLYNLRELSSNPLLLNIIVKTMPSLINENKTNTINRNSIYTKFITEWFEKERERLKNIIKFLKGSFDIDHFFEFAETLAFEMFMEGKIQIELPKKSLFGKSKEQDSLIYKLLTSDDPEYAKFRSGCPIRRVKDSTFTFMHKSYQEYFVARRLQQDIIENSKDVLNNRLLAGKAGIVNFLLEMKIDKSRLLSIVEESKTNSSIEIAASNAATILNAGRFCFSGLDLSGVCIPGADLAGAVLDSTNLSNADLCGVNLSNAFLRNTNLAKSRMEGVTFYGISHLDITSLFGNCHGDVYSISISTDGTKIVSSNVDNTLCIWDMATGSLIKTLESHKRPVDSTSISKDNTKIVSASGDSTLRIWDMATGNLIKTLNGHDVWVNCVAISADCMKIVSGSDDETIRIWDMATGKLLNTIKECGGFVYSVAISTDGNKIVSSSNDKTIRIWDMADGSLINILSGHSDRVKSVAISANGTKIVSGSYDKTICIWDMADGSLINTLKGHYDSVRSVTINANDTKIVSGSYDRTIRIWDMATGNLINTLEGHYDDVYSVAISTDGTKIVSGSKDHSVKVWDAETGRLTWTTNPRLYIKGVQFDGINIKSLLETKHRLLVQRGAIDD
ncbi:MAG: pentapeptide repeat-containing protein [Magnetococcales bacterium]|nr:pentapeptide repeat-containing protein [Nitrospirota bacterium]